MKIWSLLHGWSACQCLTVIIIIIIIDWKAQFEIFCSLLIGPRTVSYTYAQVAWAQSCANHVQHIERLWRGTCRVTCHVVRRDSSAIKFDRVEITFVWDLFYWLNQWRRGGNGSTQRKPPATSFRTCHIVQSKDSSPKQDSNPHNSIGGRLGKQTC